ncbi:MAG: hypothetical protein COB85_06405 [Bacteroidetes bacterium]|nr:MAG: hypothetical protein COB85_06405 [Bacteroidota bacterium]
MMKSGTVAILIVGGLLICNTGYSQCKSSEPDIRRPFYDVEVECAKTNSEPSFISDAQDYRALLSGNEGAVFMATFFSGNKYRICACTDIGAPLSFTVADHQGNVLFTNKDYENAPYWDLDFPVTIDCKITISLPPETAKASGGAPAEEAAESSKEEQSAEEAAEGGEEVAEEAPAERSKFVENTKVCAVLVIGYKQGE